MSAFSLSNGDAAVLGHETLANVVHGSPSLRPRAIREGDRVVVDPVLGCAPLGHPLCAQCSADHYAVCERFGSNLPRGLMMGANPRFPGGFSEEMVAHPFQLFRVPDSIPDEVAVLTEPLAIAVRAVLQNPPPDSSNVLVVGGGMIAFGVVWALREFHPDLHITLATTESHQRELALSLGASEVVTVTKDALLQSAAARTNSAVLRPVIGAPFLAGGYSHVWDCVGSHASLESSVSVLRPRGTLVLVGAAGKLAPLEWTLVWAKELRIHGTVFYGVDAIDNRRERTFTITLERMTSTSAPLRKLLTHTFDLEDFGSLIDANLDRSVSKSIKTAFRLSHTT